MRWIEMMLVVLTATAAVGRWCCNRPGSSAPAPSLTQALEFTYCPTSCVRTRSKSEGRMLRALLVLFVCSECVPPHHTWGRALWPGSVFVHGRCLCVVALSDSPPSMWWESEGLAWIWWPRWDLAQWAVLSLESVGRNWLHFENITELLMLTFLLFASAVWINLDAFLNVSFFYNWWWARKTRISSSLILMSARDKTNAGGSVVKNRRLPFSYFLVSYFSFF